MSANDERDTAALRNLALDLLLTWAVRVGFHAGPVPRHPGSAFPLEAGVLWQR